jgi:hypothetical protein
MLLDGLDKIDWPNINHSHGRATEFPTWIRQLLSDVPEVREHAQEELFEFSHHQGSIYEVTPYLVPFLIELVAAEGTPDKAYLLYHLASVGESCRWSVSRSIYGGDEHETYDRVQAGLDTYLSLLEDGDPHVRLAAFYAAASVRMFVPIWDVLDRFMATIEQERDSGVKAEMISLLPGYAREHVPQHVPESIRQRGEALAAFLLAQAHPGEANRVRLNAALAYLELFREWTRVAAHFPALFEDALRDPDAYSTGADFISTKPVIERTVEGLAYLPRAERLALLAEGVKASRYPDDAHLIGRALLDTIFYGSTRADHAIVLDRAASGLRLDFRRLMDGDRAERPDNSEVAFRERSWQSQEEARQGGRFYFTDAPEPDLTALSALEQRLLRLVLDTNMVWMLHSNLLALYGLPPERAAARSLLDRATGQP